MDNLGFEFQLGQEICFPKCPDWFQVQNSLLFNGCLGIFAGSSGHRMRLPNHLHRVTRLRKSSAIPSQHVQGQLYICFLLLPMKY
jgi:hypothetical protein